MRRLVPALIALMMAGGCGSNRVPLTASGTSARPTSSIASIPHAALIGEWQRLQKCSELEHSMNKAELHDALLQFIAEDGWIPGVTRVKQIEYPTHPCKGAVARKHSHFFTADGAFGSRDDNGKQVDDGSYRLVGDDTVVIGSVTFHYKSLATTRSS
jgi:hypothetical protein